MTDPSDALPSFQAALTSGQMRLQPGALDPDIYLHVDRTNGTVRFIYFRVENRTITAMAMLVSGPPIDETPCFPRWMGRSNGLSQPRARQGSHYGRHRGIA